MAQMLLKLNPATSYDVVKDFSPIAITGTQPAFLVVNADSGVNNFKQLMATASTRSLSMGNPGSGSPLHILGEIFTRVTHAKIAHVPYKGVVPAVNDMLGGHVPLMFITWGPVAQHVASGKIVPLAVAEPQRSQLAPDVPTLAEAGVKDFETAPWQGLLGPANLPVPIVEFLQAQIRSVLRLPEMKEKFAASGTDAIGNTPQEFAKMIHRELEQNKKVIQAVGMRAD